MTDDLLTAAAQAVESFFAGEFKTKRSIRQDMEDLRAVVNQEKKRRAQDEKQRIKK